MPPHKQRGICLVRGWSTVLAIAARCGLPPSDWSTHFRCRRPDLAGCPLPRGAQACPRHQAGAPPRGGGWRCIEPAPPAHRSTWNGPHRTFNPDLTPPPTPPHQPRRPRPPAYKATSPGGSQGHGRRTAEVSNELHLARVMGRNRVGCRQDVFHVEHVPVLGRSLHPPAPLKALCSRAPSSAPLLTLHQLFPTPLTAVGAAGIRHHPQHPRLAATDLTTHTPPPPGHLHPTARPFHVERDPRAMDLGRELQSGGGLVYCP